MSYGRYCVFVRTPKALRDAPLEEKWRYKVEVLTKRLHLREDSLNRKCEAAKRENREISKRAIEETTKILRIRKKIGILCELLLKKQAEKDGQQGTSDESS